MGTGIENPRPLRGGVYAKTPLLHGGRGVSSGRHLSDILSIRQVSDCTFHAPRVIRRRASSAFGLCFTSS